MGLVPTLLSHNHAGFGIVKFFPNALEHKIVQASNEKY
jgi:hypothetical protein